MRDMMKISRGSKIAYDILVILGITLTRHTV